MVAEHREEVSSMKTLVIPMIIWSVIESASSEQLINFSWCTATGGQAARVHPRWLLNGVWDVAEACMSSQTRLLWLA